jgi:alpha-amylase
MNKASFLLFSFLWAGLLTSGQSNSVSIDGHPAWIMQGNIYEVNVRQYTPEGTFKAFAPHLDRLRAMGVQTLWFMPINPISRVDRKGRLGSYYAVSDYDAINPEYGDLDDFIKLIRLIHEKGMKVIIDWVPNHTGADHPWLRDHPDFYVKDSSGKAAIPFDWVDTRQLDYDNLAMQDSMIASMKVWIAKTNIDGFRCDVAWHVPEAFWRRCITDLRKMKNVFMLAEGDKPYLLRSGFDAVYSWDLFHMMGKIAAGQRPAFALDSIVYQYDTAYPKNALELDFTSNHDENSWNQADFGIFPGPSHAPFAVFTQTIAAGVPLIYSGQEEPVLRPLPFFEKDTIVFEKYKRARFYSTLLHLRQKNAALASNAACKKINVGNDNALYAYMRTAGRKKLLVILNLSPQEQKVTISDSTLFGHPYNVFKGMKESLGGKPWKIGPWGYSIYDYD